MSDLFEQLEPPTSEAAGLYDLHTRIAPRRPLLKLVPIFAAAAVILLVFMWPDVRELPVHPNLSPEWPQLSVNAGSGYVAPVEVDLGGYRILYVQ